MRSQWLKVSALVLGMASILNTTQWARAEARNPVIWADVPDMSMIRVGDTYYMSSTTMHMSPGVPIMKSKDMVNWQMLNYACQTLGDADPLALRNGKNDYGRGSWASSLRYHNGTYYVSTFSHTTGKTHIYSTRDIEKGNWKETSFKPSFHDSSLCFDDDGRVYLIHGNGQLSIVELKQDLSGVKEGGVNQVIIENGSAPTGVAGGLGAEGSQLFKHNGKYYLFNICWPKDSMRTVLIHRADKITGPYEGRVALQDKGVAQGGIIDTPDGKWYSYLFQDCGAVGRIPFLVPVQWQNGWPVLGINGKVPATLPELPDNRSLIPGIVSSDEFERKPQDPLLPLAWQWNHNPDNSNWSLTERPGFLRLKTGQIAKNMMDARNSLTQRTFGPECTGAVCMNVANMKNGDVAGLAAFQKNYGIIGVKMENDTRSVVMIDAGDGVPKPVATVPLTQDMVYLKISMDFKNRTDKAYFFYSLDGKQWQSFGSTVKMAYTIPHFMGYRFALINYATSQVGGFVDFDYFHVTDKLEQK